MRTLLLLRGAMGSGKTTFIKQNDLTHYTLSADKIREMYSTPYLQDNSDFIVTQKYDREVWKILYSIMEERMKRGEFIVVDATHSSDKMFKAYRNIADRYKYQMFCKQINTPLEECIKRNSLRQDYEIVPEESIKRCKEMIELNPLPSFVKEIQNISEIDNFYIQDMSNFKKLIIIGDIHGCFEPLKKLFTKYESEKETTCFIFLGDYLDRGIQNKEVLDFILKINNDKTYNTIFLEGNHEDSLWYFGNNLNSPKLSFEKYTKPQLTNTSEEYLKLVRKFYKSLRQCMKIKFNNLNLFLNHGGLPCFPNKLGLIPTSQLIKGVGNYELDVDTLYKQNSYDTDFIQIHGHRNFGNSNDKSISLEGEIEFGGNLKYIEMFENNIQLFSIENKIFNEKLLTEDTEDIEQRKGLNTENEEINKLSKSRYIKTKHLSDNIVSLNFTENAFRSKVWNNQTIKARGLFVDKNTGKVVARSYPKFFNLHEIPNTQFSNVVKTFKLPCTVYVKENGFLGILSHHNGELLFCSKSTNQGDHVEIFKNIFYKSINNESLKKLKDCIIKNDISIIFEVIDNEKDPHIIKYDNPCLYLLDTFKNELQDNKSYALNEVKEILKQNFINFKEVFTICNTKEELEKTLLIKNSIIDKEGLVFEDAEGKMVKVKFEDYLEWKTVRNYITPNMLKSQGYFEIRRANSSFQRRIGTWLHDNWNKLDKNRIQNILYLKDIYYGGLNNGI